MANINLYFVRHGQRIDQIDSTWAATSPCPQDPPLTDQGRKQARQTGKMIRDFALEQSHHNNSTNPRSSQDATRNTSLQRITPPESPDLGHGPTSSNRSTRTTGATSSSSSSTRRHHFAIVTSPFLRCAQTAIEMAIGIRKWLSLEYASEPVPDSIIVQRMQEFALARREHEQFYSIDWKYLAQERTLPYWPETREDMQRR
ncbi:hypothetical protein CPB97_009819, partial [Podila verticillata]